MKEGSSEIFHSTGHVLKVDKSPIKSFLKTNHWILRRVSCKGCYYGAAAVTGSNYCATPRPQFTTGQETILSIPKNVDTVFFFKTNNVWYQINYNCVLIGIQLIRNAVRKKNLL